MSARELRPGEGWTTLEDYIRKVLLANRIQAKTVEDVMASKWVGPLSICYGREKIHTLVVRNFHLLGKGGA